MHSHRYHLLFGILLSLTVTTLDAQNIRSLDFDMTTLRGSWIHTSLRTEEVLIFTSDSTVLSGHTPGNYTLLPGIIRMKNDGTSIDHEYSLSENTLTLRTADGKEVAYARRTYGEAERQVDGEFYVPNVSLPDERIKFNGSGKFSFTIPDTLDVADEDPLSQNGYALEPSFLSVNGVYRVDDNQIVLTFDDGTVELARIRARDEEDRVTRLVFHKRLFTLSQPVEFEPIVVYTPPDQPTYDPPPPPPGPPCPCPYPDPPQPPADPPPVVQPAPAPSSPAPAPEHGRDWGNTRGESPRP